MSKFHTNLIPVNCSSVEDMSVLAEHMRNICIKNPDKIKGYVGSNTKEEAEERSSVVRESVISSGHLRFIRYTPDDRIVNVVLTLLDDDNKKEWNLSMSHGSSSGPKRVADDLSKLICKAFLGNSYKEVDPKAFYKEIRHFVKEYKGDYNNVNV